MLRPSSQRNDQHAQIQSDRQRLVVNAWYSWAQELFCDAIGLCIGGPAFLHAFANYLSGLDEEDFRARCRAFRAAFPDGDVHYASKAFLTTTLARWVAEEGLGLDVVSGGELERVLLADPERKSKIVFSGVGKTADEMDEALRARIHKFYQAHVDAKYRIADQVVAEDSKDLFFAAQPASNA